MRVTAILYQYLASSERDLCIRRLSPYPQDIAESPMKNMIYKNAFRLLPYAFLVQWNNLFY